jgi:hypothetical protein
MAAHEIEHDVERRMGAAATGILLDGDAGLDDVERRTPVREDARGVVGSRPLKTSRKPWLCSNSPALAVKSRSASNAAKRPLRAQ